MQKYLKNTKQNKMQNDIIVIQNTDGGNYFYKEISQFLFIQKNFIFIIENW